MPVLTVFAGPNGSGKSTFATSYSFEGKENLLDPDAVAKRINPADTSAAAIEAAREVLTRVRQYIDRSQSFALETTLSGNTALSTMKLAKRAGFDIRFVYLCLDNLGLNVERVGERVSKGGHHVPDEDVARRYTRSLANLKAAIQIADEAVGYDNSGAAPHRVFEARGGTVTWRAAIIPSWAAEL